MNKKTVPIKGMHCRSCEILVEDELSKIPGVTQVEVNHRRGEAIVCSQTQVDEEMIEHAVTNAGYSLGYNVKKPWFSRNPHDYVDVVICTIALVFIFFIANDLGLFQLVATASGNYSSLPVVFIVGLTAGLSTCMALVGGLVLGASARFAEKHPTATPLQKFKPHLFFNLGRISSYFILGGIIGYAGSFFQLSPTTLGILTIAVGGVMLLLGLQLTELFPRLSGMNITLPKGIARALGIQEHSRKEYSHKNAFIMGGLTFFLPCGFTQAMQLFAISSGSPVTGALTMGVFAIGTAPGLLGIGGLTSVIKGTIAKTFFKFAGLVVVALAFFNIVNGFTLSGLNLSVFSAFKNNTASINDPNVTLENGVQVVKMNQDSYGYSPNSFTIKKDIPVRWVINSTDSFTCASFIVSAKLGINKALQQGENIIEFTPTETGQIRFSCSMGMYSGVFNVVDESGSSSNKDNSNPSPVAQVGSAAAKPSSCGSGGCGCGGNRQVRAGEPLGNAPPITPAPTKPPVIAENVVKDNETVQLIKATYTQLNDIQPNSFKVTAGKPVRLEIDAKESGYGCMGSMALPGLSDKIAVFQSGKTMVFEFTPDKPGQYPMTCAMGVPRGSIIVI